VELQQQDFEYPSIDEIACPFGTLARIREAGSVHRVGENRFLVSHYDDVEHVLRNDKLFTGCSEERQQPFDWPGPEGVPDHSLMSNGMVKSVIEMDPPHHKSRRDRLFSLLKPARLREYRPWIEEIVDGHIDAFLDDGHVELMHQFAYPLPSQMIIRMLGFAPSDFPWLHAWAMVEWDGGAIYLTEEERDTQLPHALRAEPLLRAEILRRVETPTDDGLSEAIQAHIAEEGTFNLAIFRADISLFINAGITTTGHLISSAMMLLLRHPEVMERVRQDPSKLRLLLEEALRLDAPLQWIPRIALEDTEIDGVPIPKGSYLIAMIQSANRDEARWGANAAEFCPERSNAIDHLSFGKGPHFCIGAPLGRLEAQIAFERLLTRTRNIRIAPGTEPEYLVSPTFRGLSKLHLEFDRP
jgi:cytochrome P450